MRWEGGTMLEQEERQALRRDVKEAVGRTDARGAISACHELLSRSANPTDVNFCAGNLKGMDEALRKLEGIRALRTYVVRSVTIEPMLPNIIMEALLSGYLLELEVGGYGSYMQEMIDPKGTLAGFDPELLLVLFDLEDVAGALPEMCGDGVGARVEEEIAGCVGRVRQLIRGVRGFSRARIALQGFVVPDTSSLGDVGDANLPHSLPNAVRRLNAELARMCGEISDCVFFDVDALAARYGRGRWRDTRLFLCSRLEVSAANFEVYARGLVRSINVLYKAPRKVLCTDLDNTLWGGVLGEEGVDGIVTGSTYPGTSYFGYQQFLKQISSRGILLAAVSKNDEEGVREVFKARSADLALTLNDFAALKINWNEKVQSLRELARELSLGLDSFVLVDDNPVECEAVRQRLPEVAVIEAPVDEPWRLLEMLAEQTFFDALRVTEDDRNRLNEYKAQAQRAELESAAGGREEFLASLGIVCTFASATQAPMSRAVQLLAKTNQFNVTTRRHSAAEVEEFASAQGGQAVVVRVRDRFGDAGVVGLALARNEGDTCRIDSFLLSCRVIGRGIETALLAQIAEGAVRHGATRLVGEFIPTKKNTVCASFYPDHGFAVVEERGGEAALYELDLRTASPPVPAWIAVKREASEELPAAVAV